MTNQINLFDNKEVNLFTLAAEQAAHKEIERMEVERSVRVLRRLWIASCPNMDMSFGEFVESIITPEDNAAAMMLYDIEMERELQREEEVAKAQRDGEVIPTPVQKGAMAVMVLGYTPNRMALFTR